MIYEDQFVTHDEANSYAQSINALLYFEVCSLDYVFIENRFICVCHVFLKKTGNKVIKNVNDDKIFDSKQYSKGLYIGYLKNNKKIGKEKMTYDNGNKYDGEWVNDIKVKIKD